MPKPAIPPIVTWANSANEQEISSWIVERLHGRDRRWPEADDGFAPLSHLVALLARHPETSPSVCAVIVKEVIRHIHFALPEWAEKAEGVFPNTVAGGWTAPALADLLYLSAEILESRARRGEVRNLLVQAIPHLPKRAGGIPLRARAMAVLVELGGHPDKSFWLAQLSDDQPEALPIAFLGMAKRDLDGAMAWLGERPIEVQGDVISKLRPTLVKMAGGEIPFVIMARLSLFHGNSQKAKVLREELASIGDLALFLSGKNILTAQAFGGRALVQTVNNNVEVSRVRVPVVYTSLHQLSRAAAEIAVDNFLEDFPEPTGRPAYNKLTRTLPNYVGAICRRSREPEIINALATTVRNRQFELVGC